MTGVFEQGARFARLLTRLHDVAFRDDAQYGGGVYFLARCPVAACAGTLSMVPDGEHGVSILCSAFSHGVWAITEALGLAVSSATISLDEELP